MSLSTQSPARAHPNGPNLAGQYLTFLLGRATFGLEIMKVQEIIGLLPITHVPHLPAHVRGIVNLRGRMIAAIDLRAKFGMPSVANSPKTCIVVVEARMAGRNACLGLIVDEVAEVLSVSAADASAVGQFAGTIPMDYVLGVGFVNDGITVLLDVDSVAAFEEAVPVPNTATGRIAS